MSINDKIHQGAESVATKAQDVGHDVGEYAGKALKALFDSLGMDRKSPTRLMERLGLVRRPSAMAQVGALAVGLVVGGGAALLLAPMSGEKLRLRIREQFIKLMRAGEEAGEEAAEAAAEAAKGATTDIHMKSSKSNGHGETGLERSHGHDGLDKRQNVDVNVAKKIDDEAALSRAASDGMRLKMTASHG